ncbi:bacterio-opsin activator domain-containing protein [Halorubrum vacuolatum]|uniref:PAS domain S-box-containing protein n=1 Tax=Halorubrum vacuolatum TaxID=63740 RepID=A0A238W3F5_HALVU|nr:bacterio-opsin activator domain-containing protein [Halorubrum vacuolatum]SNR40937.1 PAS domain S-box-containing protein [Halorubrum vacuolatum]
MSRLRTLLVHPEEGADRLVDALEAADCDVTVVHHATVAMARLAAGSFDCLISEYDLPGDDGVQLAEAVRESSVDLPVVMFTRTDDDAVSEAAFESGVDRFLQRNGNASIDRLVTDVTTIGADTTTEVQQDVSGYEPGIEAIARAIDEAPIGMSLSDPELPDYPLVYVNDAWEDRTGYPAEEALGRNPRFLQGPETDPETTAEIAQAIANEELITVEIRNYKRDGTPFWNELTIAPIYDEAGEIAHYVGFQNDVTDRKTAERLAAERAEKLATERQALDRVLGRVNGLLSAVSRILVEETDPGSISEGVCAEIADEPGYMGGWIGSVSPTTGELELTAASGIPIDPPATYPLSETPEAVQQAVERDQLQGCSAGSCPEGPLSPGDVGAPRLVVVPLTYGERRYGVLGVYSGEGNALDRRERKVCESVGKMIANGLHSVETTRILTTDRVVELRVRITDRSCSLCQIADRVGGRIEHLGTTRLDRDGCELYLRTPGEIGDRSALESLPFVCSLRFVSEGEEGQTFAITTTKSPPFTALSKHGGVIVEASATANGTDLTIEAPPEREVRSLLDVLRAAYDGVELRSRSDRESRDRSLTEFASAVDERLTERQRVALKTAELNGYFEWPRPVDGSEIAETMGITRQTFHQHLRAAERKLVEAYVDP